LLCGGFCLGGWLLLSWCGFLSGLFGGFLFLFLLFTFGGFNQTEFLQGLFELSQVVFLFLWLFLLLGLLLLMGCWFFRSRLGFLLLLLLLLAFIISQIEWVSDGVELEFLFFEFFWLKATFDGFHVTKTSSQVFLRVEGLDSGLLFILFAFRLSFLFRFF
jgi:hypothetical protein